MKRDDISRAVGDIADRHIKEAAEYAGCKSKKSIFRVSFGRGAVAAAAVICLLVGGFKLFAPNNDTVLRVYAYGTEEEITSAGVIMSTGTISDSGEMTGHPLMFFLNGKSIATVRYSCKNQWINFIDWTEKRDEFGNAQNFTVPYGENEDEYYFLLIDWVPNETIRELTDNENASIKTLPENLREDIIVMEVTFENGKTATKAIKVSLQDNGTFYAIFEDYKIGSDDGFVNRPDSETIPRDVLYANPDVVVHFYGEADKEIEPIALWYNLAETKEILVTWTGVYPDNVKMFCTPTGTDTMDEMELLQVKVPLDGETSVKFTINEEDVKNIMGHMHFELTYGKKSVSTEDFNVTYDPNLTEEEKPDAGSNLPASDYPDPFDVAIKYAEDMGYDADFFVLDEMNGKVYEEMDAAFTMYVDREGRSFPARIIKFHLKRNPDVWETVSDTEVEESLIKEYEARYAAEDYYKGTVFEVFSMKALNQSDTEISFSVTVIKDGERQEADRIIILEFKDGKWIVTNEGY